MMTCTYRNAKGELCEWEGSAKDFPKNVKPVKIKILHGDPVRRNTGDPWVNHRCLSHAVHPDDAAEYERDLAALGCPTKVDRETGEPIITGKSHWNKFLSVNKRNGKPGFDTLAYY